MQSTLARLASLAATLVNAPMAAFVRINPGRVDILAGHHISGIAYAVELDESAAGLSLDQAGVVCDTSKNPYFRAHPMVTGAPWLKALIHVPVPAPGRVALVIGYNEPIIAPDLDRIQALDDLARLAAYECKINEVHQTAITWEDSPLDELIRKADHLPQPMALLDHDLNYIHVNAAMGVINSQAPESHVGRSIRQMKVPSVEAMEAIFQIALRDGRSFEQIDLIGERNSEHVRIFSISCRPLCPKNMDKPILEVIISDVTTLREDEMRLEDGLAQAPFLQPFDMDPTARFLIETLVKRQSLRQRKSTSYLTLRSWRKPVRSYQIEALKALKTAPPHALIDAAAGEIVEAVTRIVGISSFAHVTPIPCSRSAEGACLSLLIAREVSRQIGKPLSLLLSCAPRKGTSHPKENATCPPLRLLAPAAGPCLIIDDVATSGAHIEEGIKKLRPSAHSVFAVAWIGGDADDKPDTA